MDFTCKNPVSKFFVTRYLIKNKKKSLKNIILPQNEWMVFS